MLRQARIGRNPPLSVHNSVHEIPGSTAGHRAAEGVGLPFFFPSSPGAGRSSGLAVQVLDRFSGAAAGAGGRGPWNCAIASLRLLPLKNRMA